MYYNRMFVLERYVGNQTQYYNHQSGYVLNISFADKFKSEWEAYSTRPDSGWHPRPVDCFDSVALA